MDFETETVTAYQMTPADSTTEVFPVLVDLPRQYSFSTVFLGKMGFEPHAILFSRAKRKCLKMQIPCGGRVYGTTSVAKHRTAPYA